MHYQSQTFDVTLPVPEGVLDAPAMAALEEVFGQERTLAIPREAEHWPLATLREKLVKIGAKVVRHGRYVTFQLAEVAVPSNLFREIPRRVDELRRRPAPA